MTASALGRSISPAGRSVPTYRTPAMTRALTCAEGTKESTCTRFRPFSQYNDWREIYRGKRPPRESFGLSGKATGPRKGRPDKASGNRCLRPCFTFQRKGKGDGRGSYDEREDTITQGRPARFGWAIRKMEGGHSFQVVSPSRCNE